MGTSTQEGLLLKEIIFITIITMRIQRATLLLCAVIVLTEASIRCPGGWSFHNLRCFKFFPEKVNWITAEKHCLGLGGNLASITNHAEHTFALNLLASNNGGGDASWIGGSDAIHERIWLWSDGLPMTFTAWARGQPDNGILGGQNCAVMNWSRQRLWDDQGCNVHNTYICAMNAAGRF